MLKDPAIDDLRRLNMASYAQAIGASTDSSPSHAK
jgi:hypothetical protein